MTTPTNLRATGAEELECQSQIRAYAGAQCYDRSYSFLAGPDGNNQVVAGSGSLSPFASSEKHHPQTCYNWEESASSLYQQYPRSARSSLDYRLAASAPSVQQFLYPQQDHHQIQQEMILDHSLSLLDTGQNVAPHRQLMPYGSASGNVNHAMSLGPEPSSISLNPSASSPNIVSLLEESRINGSRKSDLNRNISPLHWQSFTSSQSNPTEGDLDPQTMPSYQVARNLENIDCQQGPLLHPSKNYLSELALAREHYILGGEIEYGSFRGASLVDRLSPNPSRLDIGRSQDSSKSGFDLYASNLDNIITSYHDGLQPQMKSPKESRKRNGGRSKTRRKSASRRAETGNNPDCATAGPGNPTSNADDPFLSSLSLSKREIIYDKKAPSCVASSTTVLEPKISGTRLDGLANDTTPRKKPSSKKSANRKKSPGKSSGPAKSPSTENKSSSNKGKRLTSRCPNSFQTSGAPVIDGEHLPSASFLVNDIFSGDSGAEEDARTTADQKELMDEANSKQKSKTNRSKLDKYQNKKKLISEASGVNAEHCNEKRLDESHKTVSSVTTSPVIDLCEQKNISPTGVEEVIESRNVKPDGDKNAMIFKDVLSQGVKSTVAGDDALDLSACSHQSDQNENSLSISDHNNQEASDLGKIEETTNHLYRKYLDVMAEFSNTPNGGIETSKKQSVHQHIPEGAASKLPVKEPSSQVESNTEDANDIETVSNSADPNEENTSGVDLMKRGTDVPIGVGPTPQLSLENTTEIKLPNSVNRTEDVSNSQKSRDHLQNNRKRSPRISSNEAIRKSPRKSSKTSLGDACTESDCTVGSIPPQNLIVEEVTGKTASRLGNSNRKTSDKKETDNNALTMVPTCESGEAEHLKIDDRQEPKRSSDKTNGPSISSNHKGAIEGRSRRGRPPGTSSKKRGNKTSTKKNLQHDGVNKPSQPKYAGGDMINIADAAKHRNKEKEHSTNDSPQQVGCSTESPCGDIGTDHTKKHSVSSDVTRSKKSESKDVQLGYVAQKSDNSLNISHTNIATKSFAKRNGSHAEIRPLNESLSDADEGKFKCQRVNECFQDGNRERSRDQIGDLKENLLGSDDTVNKIEPSESKSSDTITPPSGGKFLREVTGHGGGESTKAKHGNAVVKLSDAEADVKVNVVADADADANEIIENQTEAGISAQALCVPSDKNELFSALHSDESVDGPSRKESEFISENKNIESSSSGEQEGEQRAEPCDRDQNLPDERVNPLKKQEMEMSGLPPKKEENNISTTSLSADSIQDAVLPSLPLCRPVGDSRDHAQISYPFAPLGQLWMDNASNDNKRHNDEVNASHLSLQDGGSLLGRRWVWDEGYFADGHLDIGMGGILNLLERTSPTDILDASSEDRIAGCTCGLDHLYMRMKRNSFTKGDGATSSRMRRSERSSSSTRISNVIAELANGRLNPHTLIACEDYTWGPEYRFVKNNQTESVQPFSVRVSPDAAFMADLHAHLCESEIIGFLGGHYSVEEKCIYVQAAFPCKSTDRSDAGHTDVEMDPVSQIHAREAIASHGMSVVGWYHSHPTFQPDPSVTDIENQANYQQLFRSHVSGKASQDIASSPDIDCGESVETTKSDTTPKELDEPDSEEDSTRPIQCTNTVIPFVGLIVGTYDMRNPTSQSVMTWFHVTTKEAEKNKFVHFPMNLKITQRHFRELDIKGKSLSAFPKYDDERVSELRGEITRRSVDIRKELESRFLSCPVTQLSPYGQYENENKATKKLSINGPAEVLKNNALGTKAGYAKDAPAVTQKNRRSHLFNYVNAGNKMSKTALISSEQLPTNPYSRVETKVPLSVQKDDLFPSDVASPVGMVIFKENPTIASTSNYCKEAGITSSQAASDVDKNASNLSGSNERTVAQLHMPPRSLSAFAHGYHQSLVKIHERPKCTDHFDTQKATFYGNHTESTAESQEGSSNIEAGQIYLLLSESLFEKGPTDETVGGSVLEPASPLYFTRTEKAIIEEDPEDVPLDVLAGIIWFAIEREQRMTSESASQHDLSVSRSSPASSAAILELLLRQSFTGSNFFDNKLYEMIQSIGGKGSAILAEKNSFDDSDAAIAHSVDVVLSHYASKTRRVNPFLTWSGAGDKGFISKESAKAADSLIRSASGAHPSWKDFYMREILQMKPVETKGSVVYHNGAKMKRGHKMAACLLRWASCMQLSPNFGSAILSDTNTSHDVLHNDNGLCFDHEIDLCDDVAKPTSTAMARHNYVYFVAEVMRLLAARWREAKSNDSAPKNRANSKRKRGRPKKPEPDSDIASSTFTKKLKKRTAR